MINKINTLYILINVFLHVNEHFVGLVGNLLTKSDCVINTAMNRRHMAIHSILFSLEEMGVEVIMYSNDIVIEIGGVI